MNLNDVVSIDISDGSVVVVPDIASMVITVDELPVNSITVTTDQVAGAVSRIAELLGIQGPSGLQNVWVGTEPTSPKLNDIWIQI